MEYRQFGYQIMAGVLWMEFQLRYFVILFNMLFLFAIDYTRGQDGGGEGNIG